MLCDTRGSRCFLVALNHVIFDPQSQSSIPQSNDQTHDAHLGVFCMKKHIHANTAGRKVESTEKKGYPDQYYMYPTFVFFDTLYKANDSNSYIFDVAWGKKDLHCLYSISTMMETQT